MMALPPQASNQKLARLPLRSAEFGAAKRLLSILFAGMIAAASTVSTEEEPLRDEEHERDELGVNSYTAPSIARIFQQLDQLKPAQNRCPLINSNVISLHRFPLAVSKSG